LRTLEIIIPARNPTAVLEQTIRSLVTQTDRRFSVLLSDNHSTQGVELLDAAARELEGAGIAVRRVRPLFELGRVEHWNWAHHVSSGDWLKPLFLGDWLEPNYVGELRAVVSGYPECRYVFASYVYHLGDSPAAALLNPWAGRFIGAEQMERIVLRKGMQFGPPSAAAYERTALISLGGYPTTLPICADSLLFCAMASRFGALGLADPLCHFNIHAARFSTSLPQQRRNTLRENVTYYFMLAYRAWSERAAFSWTAFARLLAREFRAYLAKRQT
jgi:glycosyltransferase involved in cell wall biosynthesis